MVVSTISHIVLPILEKILFLKGSILSQQSVIYINHKNIVFVHTQTHIHTHTHTHTHIESYTHTQTHTHTRSVTKA